MKSLTCMRKNMWVEHIIIFMNGTFTQRLVLKQRQFENGLFSCQVYWASYESKILTLKIDNTVSS